MGPLPWVKGAEVVKGAVRGGALGWRIQALRAARRHGGASPGIKRPGSPFFPEQTSTRSTPC